MISKTITILSFLKKFFYRNYAIIYVKKDPIEMNKKLDEFSVIFLNPINLIIVFFSNPFSWMSFICWYCYGSGECHQWQSDDLPNVYFTFQRISIFVILVLDKSQGEKANILGFIKSYIELWLIIWIVVTLLMIVSRLSSIHVGMSACMYMVVGWLCVCICVYPYSGWDIFVWDH